MRTVLLFSAAVLMAFGAFGNALVVVPDLHGDLIEIGVRPTVLGGTMLGLDFSVFVGDVCVRCDRAGNRHSDDARNCARARVAFYYRDLAEVARARGFL